MILPPVPVANYASLLAARLVASNVKPYAPVAFRTGGETFLEGSGVLVLDESTKWSQVWARHTKNEWLGESSANRTGRPPEVDFNRNLLVAIFAGPTRRVVGYRIVNGFTLGKASTLRLAPVVDASGRTTAVVPTPWAFVILPRTDTTVSIEIAGANGWNKVAQVPPSL